MKKGEPWYIHVVLYVIIIALAYVLIRVAIIDPSEVIEKEQYYKSESRLRMMNLREAEKLYEKKFGHFTDKMDSLLYFIKSDESVKKVMEGTDSITGKPTNPFKNLSSGLFEPDSIFKSPKSFNFFLLTVDTLTERDTVIDRRGSVIRIDSSRVIGRRYYIECPDGYGSVGDLNNEARKNAASWE